MEEIITEKNFRKGLKVKFSSLADKRESRYLINKDAEYGEIASDTYGNTFSITWFPSKNNQAFYAKEIAVFSRDIQDIYKSIHEIIEGVL